MDNRDENMKNSDNPDQSRMLWVVLSALTVIAIVIAAGLFFFFPSTEGNVGQPRLSSLSSEKQGTDFDPVEYVRNADGYPEMEAPGVTDNEFSMGQTEEPIGDLPVKEPVAKEPEIVIEDDSSNVVEVVPVAAVETPKKEEPVTAPAKHIQETRKVSVTVYWIQVGSYKDLTKAEEVRTYLLREDVSSEIQTRAVDGTTYYRVRIGAFQSKGEADKFLNPIRDMKNFEESYVVQTTMIREVPVN